MSETLTLNLNHTGWISVSETYQILCDLSNISLSWLSSECCCELGSHSPNNEKWLLNNGCCHSVLFIPVTHYLIYTDVTPWLHSLTDPREEALEKKRACSDERLRHPVFTCTKIPVHIVLILRFRKKSFLVALLCCSDCS